MRYLFQISKKLAFLMCLASASLAAVCVEEGEFALGYTYREDSLHWSIANFDNSPNILSELSWKDLRINQISAWGRAITTNRLYFRAGADYGRIFHGRNTDTDYDGDDRTDEVSRSVSNAGKGEVFDLTAGFGYQLKFLCDRLRLAPLIGASWEEQHLRLYDGKLLFPFVEPIENLHSSYKTRWYGPWIGFDLDFDLNEQIAFFAAFEYHWSVYRGIGHWNLRDDFLTDFKHRSHGTGIKFEGGASYAFKGNWKLALLAGYSSWSTRPGKHRVTIDSFDGPEVLETRLNEVFWRSFRTSVMLTYSF